MSQRTEWTRFAGLGLLTSLAYFLIITGLGDPALHYIAAPIIRALRAWSGTSEPSSHVPLVVFFWRLPSALVLGLAWAIYLLPLLLLRSATPHVRALAVVTVLPALAFVIASANTGSDASVLFFTRIALSHVVACAAFLLVATYLGFAGRPRFTRTVEAAAADDAATPRR